MKNVDWNKEPEIRWERKVCPICHGPTGDESNCHLKDPGSDSSGSIDDLIDTKTIEVNGELFPIFNKQCFYRKRNDFLVFTNYPISNGMANQLAAVDGIDAIVIRTPYRMDVTIAEQFDNSHVKNIFNKNYRSFINDHRKTKSS
jgi:hypothetical protein